MYYFTFLFHIFYFTDYALTQPFQIIPCHCNCALVQGYEKLSELLFKSCSVPRVKRVKWKGLLLCLPSYSNRTLAST